MATTPLQLKNLIKLELNEAQDAKIATLYPGDGGAEVTSTDEAIIRLINDATELIATSCYPLRAFAFKAVVRGDYVDRFNEFLIDDTDHPDRVSYMWAAEAVEYAGSPLEYINRQTLQNYYPDWRNSIINASTLSNPPTPQYWSDEGRVGIVIYPGYPDFGVVGMHGFQVPAKAINTVDDNDEEIFNWLPEGAMHLLIDYPVFRLGILNKDDSTIYNRALDHLGTWNAKTFQYWEAIDPILRAKHFPIAPSFFVPGVSQGQ